jgi:hypothetical protein
LGGGAGLVEQAGAISGRTVFRIQIEEKGLSERYYGIPRGTAENWVLSLGLGYSIREKRRADVILACG